VVIGEGSGEWPVAEGSLPANLKVVTLTTRGSGTVVEDNAKEIAAKLFKAAGRTGSGVAVLRSPQNGLMIGGTQTVTPQAKTASGHGSNSPKNSSGGCSLEDPGADTDSPLVAWWAFVGAIVARRRRSLRS
jgi:hypothetical protein